MPDQLAIDGAPIQCLTCRAPLCLRKQVVNLALGNTDSMFCLSCLGKEAGKTEIEVLSELKSYIKMRDCYRKEWKRYADADFCPDPSGCFPSTCFETASPSQSRPNVRFD